MSEEASGAKAPIKIKKYANRRLYNTATSSYVTLDHLCQMVKDGVDFAVFDAKSGDEITRSVLTQIIVEEESKGQNLLPIGFLRQLISFYGDNMQQMLLPKYLDFSMKSFSENQEKMRHYMEDTFGSVFPFGQFEEMSKQNLAMFERTMQLFAPGADGTGAAGGEQSSAPQTDSGKSASDIEALQKQIDAMQQQLKKIGEKSS
ncbi:polyhydroxyalkanoate synthesis repressor PhaR [Hwanghaeella grinnelliae]|uniref:Polyhydroxyalkanoate synthesis repressor PhaR n=1 Tax=Hwanghaeella grinnelliae TaxID=2500179 RepID=A0A3S2W9Y6_9PROT|nr:polyhydroxyalkanoate synthesis repressor PhaR [Hwanghaeella grinnelliae]RVU36819.1 polyhydroxyalkanoate synthesis repressor PhaR [Hwanghaeella grinnelliae]